MYHDVRQSHRAAFPTHPSPATPTSSPAVPNNRRLPPPTTLVQLTQGTGPSPISQLLPLPPLILTRRPFPTLLPNQKVIGVWSLLPLASYV